MHTTRRPATAVVALLLAATTALAGCGSSSAPVARTAAPAADGGAPASVTGLRHLDVEGFAGVATAPGTVLLDVRTPQEYAEGHLAGAQLLNFRASDFDARLGLLDRGATYAVYCHSGNRSGQALQRMAAAGFTRVADLSGGIAAWTAAGRPVTA